MPICLNLCLVMRRAKKLNNSQCACNRLRIYPARCCSSCTDHVSTFHCVRSPFSKLLLLGRPNLYVRNWHQWSAKRHCHVQKTAVLTPISFLYFCMRLLIVDYRPLLICLMVRCGWDHQFLFSTNYLLFSYCLLFTVRKENEVVLRRAELRMVRWMCGIKVQDRVPSKGLRERLWIRWHNFGTTAKQVVMVWACSVKRRQWLGKEMYGVWSGGFQAKR